MFGWWQFLMFAVYSIWFYVVLLAFSVWLYLFRNALSDAAFYSLFFIVLGGFAILGHGSGGRYGFERSDWANSAKLMLLVLIGMLVIMDLLLARPGAWELALQLIVVLAVGIRLFTKRRLG